MNKYLVNTNNSSDGAQSAASYFSCAGNSEVVMLSTCLVAVLIFILSIFNILGVITLTVILICMLNSLKKQPIC